MSAEREGWDRDQGDRASASRPLFPGEWQDSPFREDAEHWVATYEALVIRAGELAAAADGSRDAVVAAQRRYQRRLEFWRRRLEEFR